MSVEKKCQRSGWSGFGPFVYYRGELPACPCPRAHGRAPGSLSRWHVALLGTSVSRSHGKCGIRMELCFFKKTVIPWGHHGVPCLVLALHEQHATSLSLDHWFGGELFFVGQIGRTRRNVVWLPSVVLVWHLGAWPCAVCLDASPSPCHRCLVCLLLGNITACLV